AAFIAVGHHEFHRRMAVIVADIERGRQRKADTIAADANALEAEHEIPAGLAVAAVMAALMGAAEVRHGVAAASTNANTAPWLANTMSRPLKVGEFVEAVRAFPPILIS